MMWDIAIDLNFITKYLFYFLFVILYWNLVSIPIIINFILNQIGNNWE